MKFKVGKCPKDTLAITNKVYINTEDASALDATREKHAFSDEESGGGRFTKIGRYVYTYEGHKDVKKGVLALNSGQRRDCEAGLGDTFDVTPYKPSTDNVILAQLDLEADLLKKSKEAVSVDAAELANHVLAMHTNQFLSVGQQLLTVFSDVKLRITVQRCQVVSINSLASMASDDAGAATVAAEDGKLGQLRRGTNITLKQASGSMLRLSGASATVGGAGLLLDWDFERMGIGGLDKEFNTIFRRAFASRIYPPAVLQKIGMKPVRGMLLFGPPGCGKTLMAREIGKMLNGKDPVVVQGPEVLSKYVGESEANIRKLFEPARKEQEERGLDSDLHIIIMDELDAICRSRGSRSDSTGVHDGVVNSLLAMIDGTESLNNILVIGMTNRKELIDPALLRPGRLEVHMEISLPDEHGRVQIFKIHTAQMLANGFMEPDAVSLEDLAHRTKNYSGAEIEAVVRSAQSWAMNRQVDVKNLTKAPDAKDLRITHADFEAALEEIQPAFGVSKDDFEGTAPNGILSFGKRFEHLSATCRAFVRQARESQRTPLVSLLLHGSRGCGKTALACSLAVQSEFPFVQLISPEKLVGYSETSKLQKIADCFEAAYRSPLAVLVIDDLERLFEYVPSKPARFSNTLLQALLVLLNKRPPHNRRLLILATTSNIDVLKELEMFNCFDAALAIPRIETQEEFEAVLSSLALDTIDEATVKRVSASFPSTSEGISMKKLIMLVEMAKQGSKERFAERLINLLAEHV